MRYTATIIILILLLSVPLFAQELGSVSGSVSNQNDEAVAGSNIILTSRGERPLRAQSDENGNFNFNEVPIGEWTIQVTGRGYLPFREEIEIAVDQAVELEIVLEVAGGRGGDDEEVEFGSISGSVTNEDGEAVAEARVMLNGRGQRPLQGQTDENGEFNFAEVPVGEWAIQIVGRGYMPFREDIEVVVDQAVELEIVLEVAGGRGGDDDEEVEFGGVSGSVTNEDGEAVPEARVVLSARGQRALQSQTDENGVFNFEEVPVGEWVIQVAGRGYLPFREDIEVAVDQVVELEVVLEVAGGRGDDEDVEFGGVAGSVANEDGEAVPEARVVLSARGQRALQAQTDENGAFTFDEVPVGEWTIQIAGRGYLPFRADIEVAVDQAVELEIVLEVAGGRGGDDDEEVEFGSVSGSVINEDGEAVAEATVLLSSRGQRSHRSRTDNNGEFTFNDVPVGDWTIQVSGRGYFVFRDEVAVEVDQAIELEIVLETAGDRGEVELGSVSGSVVDENGDPIELAHIRLVPANRENWRQPGWMRPQVVFSNEDGLFEIVEVPAGEYLARSAKRGFEHADLELEVVVDENTELEFVLVARGEREQQRGGLNPHPPEEVELQGITMIVDGDNGETYLLDIDNDLQPDYLLNFGPDYYEPGNGAVRPEVGDEIAVPGILVGHMEPQMLIVSEINGQVWRDVYYDHGGQFGYGSAWHNYNPDGILVEAEGFSIVGGNEWQNRCLIDIDEDNSPDYRLIFGDESYDPESGIGLPNQGRFNNIIGAQYEARDGIPIIIVYQIDGIFWREPGDISGLDWNNAQDVGPDHVQAPVQHTLMEAYPNPFNPEITISIMLPEGNNIKLTVFDLQGREIHTIFSGHLNIGQHSFILDGRDLNAGIYFVRLESEIGCALLKLTLLK